MSAVREIPKHVLAVRRMSDSDLLVVWDALRTYDPAEEYSPGVSMDEWAETVYSELSHRHLACTNC